MNKLLKYYLQLSAWISFTLPLLFLGLGLYAYFNALHTSSSDELTFPHGLGQVIEVSDNLYTYIFSIAICTLLISIPFGLAASMYVSEYADRSTRNTLKGWVRFQFVIPPLTWWILGVYCLFTLGIQVIQPLYWGLIWGLVMMPFTTSMFYNTIGRVSKSEKTSAYALGANQLQVISMVILPEIKSRLYIVGFLVFVRSFAEMAIVFMFLIEELRQPLLILISASLLLFAFALDQMTKNAQKNP